jgi:hypothetical protein
MRGLGSYIKEKLNEAATADEVNEALSRSFEESPESGAPAREAVEPAQELGPRQSTSQAAALELHGGPPSRPSWQLTRPHCLLTFLDHSEVPRVYGVVIGFSWAGDCQGWCIWQKGIVGDQGCSIGLGWHPIAHDGIADFIFHGFQTVLRAQPAELPLLPGFLAGAS